MSSGNQLEMLPYLGYRRGEGSEGGGEGEGERGRRRGGGERGRGEREGERERGGMKGIKTHGLGVTKYATERQAFNGHRVNTRVFRLYVWAGRVRNRVHRMYKANVGANVRIFRVQNTRRTN